MDEEDARDAFRRLRVQGDFQSRALPFGMKTSIFVGIRFFASQFSIRHLSFIRVHMIPTLGHHNPDDGPFSRWHAE